MWRNRGPIEAVCKVFLNRNNDYAGPELWDAEFRGVQKPPICFIPELGELALQSLPVVLEYRTKKATDVFDHYRARSDFINQPYGRRKQIPVVLSAKLFACYGKWWARQAAG